MTTFVAGGAAYGKLLQSRRSQAEILAELIGPQWISLDSILRSDGIVRSAERRLREMTDPRSRRYDSSIHKSVINGIVHYRRA